MIQTQKEINQHVMVNDLSWPRRVMIQWLRSFFKHSSDFNYNDDCDKTSIVVLDAGGGVGNYHENIDRVIIKRLNFNNQSIIMDNRIRVDNTKFIYDIVKPRLGYLNIFCESRNEIRSEFIATNVETALLIHKDQLLEMNVGIGDPTLSDVKEPYSGTSFYSMMVSVPTIVIGHASFSVKDPQMLQSIEMEFGVGDNINFNVET